jgi:hypothetical protein
MSRALTRREVVLSGAATVAAASVVRLPLPKVTGIDLGLGEFGPEKYFLDWWDKAEIHAFAGLRDGRFDAVVESQ